jgi:hypothetical protein
MVCAGRMVEVLPLLAKLFDSIESKESMRYHSHKVVVFKYLGIPHIHIPIYFSVLVKDVLDSERTRYNTYTFALNLIPDHLCLGKVGNKLLN